MADVKISQLPSATTPLAGTEVLPIVQGGVTSKVSAADMTAGRAVSMSSATVSTGNLTFGSTAQRITGDFSNATLANRLMFQTSTTNSATTVGVLPNGTSTASALRLFSNIDTANASLFDFGITSSVTYIGANISGTGTYLPMTFYTGGSERVRIATTGGVSVGSTTDPGAGALSATGGIRVTGIAGLGYNTGAGTVTTQSTSKTTAVTVNRPTGQITMASDALAAGASVEFTVNSTQVTTSDVVAVNTVSYPSYVAQCKYVSAGSFVIRVTNTSGGSLSEPLILNFAVIKGATA